MTPDIILQPLIDSLTSGVTHRGDCPYCGGKNTFTLVKAQGSIKWNCYKLECNAKGDTSATLDKNEVVKLIVNPIPDTSTYPIFDIPDYWTRPNEEMIAWMGLWGVLRALTEGRINGYYDPKEDRYAFVAYHGGKPVGAQGRSDDKYAKVKWKNYSEIIRVPFIVPQTGTYAMPTHMGEKVGIIVEDITSAAVVSQYADGIALMGTNLIASYIPLLQEYNHIVVCLDKDANHKSIEMSRELCWYTNASLRISDYDPKNMSSKQLDDTFGGLL